VAGQTGPQSWTRRKASPIDEAIARLNELLRAVDEVSAPEIADDVVEEEIAAAALRAIKAEQERARLFGADLFPNPGWSILLHLFLSGLEGRQVSMAALCAATGLPEAVALRHVSVLVGANLVRRQAVKCDIQATYLMLSSEGKRRLCTYFNPGQTDRDAAAA
jgi:hypothetical protein